MRNSCPKTCPLIQHPDVGVVSKRIPAGEKFVISRSNVNTLVFTLKGDYVVSSEERRDYHVGEREMVLCYHDYNYDFVAQSDLEVIQIYFVSLGEVCDLGTLRQMGKKAKREEHYKHEFASQPVVDELYTLLTTLRIYAEDEIHCDHVHRAAINLVFGVMRFYYTPRAQLKLFYNLISFGTGFRALVENNCSKAHNLNHLAQLCGYEIASFNVIFRRFYPDITPHVWMQERRKTEILRYLQRSDAKIKFVATKFGFSSSSHLGEFCKRYLGDTPRNLRKKYQQENEVETKW